MASALYTEVEEAIKERFGVAETEVLYGGNFRDETNHNTHKFLARVPLNEEKAFDFVESMNFPFDSKNGTYTIRQDESTRYQDKEQTNGWFGFTFLVERNCI